MGGILLYFAFLFFGGAGATHKRIHHRAPRRRKTKKPGAQTPGYLRTIAIDESETP
jgi:hypothetical protein